MQVGGKLAVGVAVVAGFLGYQYFIHTVVTAGQLTPVSVAVVLAPFTIAVGWALKVDRGWYQSILIVSSLVLLGFAAFSYFGFEHSVITFGLPHLATNLFLMWFFARTLRTGREAIITTVARKVHGSLKPEIERYTRSVTLAWSLFFAMQVAISVTLFFFAPLEVWSTYINLLNAPMVILMFIVEYIYRVLRFREHKSSIFSAAVFFRHDSDHSETDRAQ